MNTKTFEQFDVMTDAELSTVEGGKNKEGRNMGCILGTAGMAGAGFGAALLLKVSFKRQQMQSQRIVYHLSYGSRPARDTMSPF